MKKNNFFLCVLGLVIFTSFSVNAQSRDWSSNKSVNRSSNPIANTFANKLFQIVDIPNIELAKTDGIIDESFTNTFVASLGVAKSLKKENKNLYKKQEDIALLDSVIYYQTNPETKIRFKVKDTYKFDVNGKIISLLVQYEKYEVWIDAFRAFYEYDTNNNEIKTIGEQYDEASEKWMDFAIKEQTYEGNNLIEIVLISWFDAEKTDWKPISKNNFTYNSDNKLISEYQEKWQVIDEVIVWEKVVRIDYSYDSKKNDFRKTYFSYHTEKGWINLVRFSNFYDTESNFHIRTETEQWYDTEWKYSLWQLETNDENGNNIGIIYQRYDIASSTWINSQRSEQEFNADNLSTQSVGYYWDTTITEDDKWVKQGGNFSIYDGTNITQLEGKSWNKLFNRYDNVFKYSYLRHPDGLLSSFRSEVWTEDSWQLKNGGMWFMYNGDRYDYIAEEFVVYYKDLEPIVFTLSNTDIETNKFSLDQNYPNPFSGSTTIEYNMVENGFVTLTIFDITGKQVSSLINEKQTKGNHKVSFNSNGQLQGGVYYYTLNVNGFSQTKKLIIQ